MNVFAFGFADEIFVKVVYHLIEHLDIDFVEYYFDTPTEIGKRVASHGQYYVEIQEGRYDRPLSAMIPLDEKLIEEMSGCEQATLRMMDRNDIWNPLTYAQRKTLYLKHLRNWNDVLERRDIDIAIFSNVPHGVFDFVVYSLCKLKGIPVLLLACPALLTDVLFIGESWEDPAPELGLRYKGLLAEGKLADAENMIMGEKFEAHFKAQTRTDADPPIPYHMSQAWFDNNKEPTYLELQLRRIKRLLSQPAILVSKAGSPIFWIRKLQLHIAQRTQRRLERAVSKYYDDHCAVPDLEKKFIYVPLQQQPEATTSPMAGAYVDQYLLVQQLSACVPDDVLIYVKEHPYQHWGGVAGRDLSEYEQMTELKNVRFVPKTFSTYELIDHCIAVATSTGTAGWEGLFKQKPFLMFGHHIYQYAPGVFQIRTVDECREAIKAVMNGFKPTLNEMRLFLKAMEDVAIIGFTDAMRRQIVAISDESNASNIANGFIAEMKRIGVVS